MKKFLAVLEVAALASLLPVSAHAKSTESLDINGVVKISYPSSIKLKPNGCQKVKIKYRIGVMDLDYVYVGLQVDKENILSDKVIYMTPGLGDRNYKKKSTATLKICRESRVEYVGDGKDGEYQSFLGAETGLVQITIETSEYMDIGFVRFK